MAPQGSGAHHDTLTGENCRRNADRAWQRLARCPQGSEVEDPQRDRDVEPQVRVGGERAEQPLQLADPVAHGVVVEELQPGGLGHVEVGVEQHLQGLAQVGRLRRRRRPAGRARRSANACSSAGSGTSAISRCTPSSSKHVVEPGPRIRRPTSTARRACSYARAARRRSATGGSPRPRTGAGHRPGRRRPPATTRRTTSCRPTGRSRPASTGRGHHLRGEVGRRDRRSRPRGPPAARPWAKRSCHCRRSWLETGSSSGAAGRSRRDHHDAGRARSHPSAASVLLDVRLVAGPPEEAGRAGSRPGTCSRPPVTACSRVISSAAMVAASSRACDVVAR